jgi:hypothetical protein
MVLCYILDAVRITGTWLYLACHNITRVLFMDKLGL